MVRAARPLSSKGVGARRVFRTWIIAAFPGCACEQCKHLALSVLRPHFHFLLTSVLTVQAVVRQTFAAVGCWLRKRTARCIRCVASSGFGNGSGLRMKFGCRGSSGRVKSHALSSGKGRSSLRSFGAVLLLGFGVARITECGDLSGQDSEVFGTFALRGSVAREAARAVLMGSPRGRPSPGTRRAPFAGPLGMVRRPETKMPALRAGGVS